jgi:glycine betaine/choline ABC-type transport system substrate-binding protein
MLLGIESEGVQDLKRLNKRSKELDHGITWLEPLGFTNNYVIVANKNKIKKVKYIHQLTGEADQLTFGGNLEFMNRSDGYPGLCKTYNLNFRKEVICSYHDRYRLLKEQKVDVIDGFETDPELEDDDFKVLEESRQPPFFPEYHALPVFREDALDKIKGLRDVVEQFKDRLGKINRIEVIAQFSDFSGTDKDEFEAAEKQARKIVEEIDKNVRMGSGQEMA